MKLLCLNYEYPPIGGGGAVVCEGLAEALIQKGYSIDVVTSRMGGLPLHENRNGVDIHRAKCLRLHPHYVNLPEMLTLVVPMYLKALGLIRRKTYHLNHTHFIFPSAIVSYLLKKRTGLPYVITCHGSDVPGYNPDRFKLSHSLLGFFWKRVVAESSGVVAPSHFMKMLVQSRMPVPVEVIPNGYRPSTHIDSVKENRILTVTRMFERKGIQFLIKAAESLNTGWQILVAGDGPFMSKLRELAKNVPSIKFLGFVKGHKLSDLYQTSKIFVFPSTEENFPVVLLEAMSAGCAIITTDAPGCVEVVGNAAIKTRRRNAADLREAIEILVQNEFEINRLSRLARNRFSNFTWAKVSQRYDRFFKTHTGGQHDLQSHRIHALEGKSPSEPLVIPLCFPGQVGPSGGRPRGAEDRSDVRGRRKIL